MISIDEELRRKVVEQLRWDSRLEIPDLMVEVTGQKVILSGTAGTLMEKLLAERDVRIIPGVREVENLLQVRYPEDTPGISDSEIQESILFMLKHSSIINADKIKVTVSKGVVTLEGVVRSFWERVKAEDIAEDVTGVTGIKNELIVALPEVVPDHIIQEDIFEALRRTYAINPDEIQVEVRKGAVTISGIVPTWDLYFDVENIAKHTHGVTNVKNLLSVE